MTPFVLGQIVALYEHRVFVEGDPWHQLLRPVEVELGELPLRSTR
ncbi:MAG: hypothetical protein R3D61_04695 [Defluviimonas denitrificans]